MIAEKHCFGFTKGTIPTYRAAACLFRPKPCFLGRRSHDAKFLDRVFWDDVHMMQNFWKWLFVTSKVALRVRWNVNLDIKHKL